MESWIVVRKTKFFSKKNFIFTCSAFAFSTYKMKDPLVSISVKLFPILTVAAHTERIWKCYSKQLFFSFCFYLLFALLESFPKFQVLFQTCRPNCLRRRRWISAANWRHGEPMKMMSDWRRNVPTEDFGTRDYIPLELGKVMWIEIYRYFFCVHLWKGVKKLKWLSNCNLEKKLLKNHTFHQRDHL